MAIFDDDGHPVPTGGDGEICVRGAGVMLGYWKSAEQTASTVVDGWLHTGDIGRLDDDGFLYVVDRKKDLIIRGGYNITPSEIENVLYRHPAVLEAAVVGLPDREWGEQLVMDRELEESSRGTGCQIELAKPDTVVDL